jgi:hypothetical protein
VVCPLLFSDLTGDQKLRLPVPVEERGGPGKGEKIVDGEKGLWVEETLRVAAMNNSLNSL